jgi:hypothetical protein
MIAIASCSLIAVFGIARLFLSDKWSLLTFLIAATSPFIIHEIYFTWPKLAAASFVLLAAYLIFKAKYFQAGLVLGVGYLCHPLALLFSPALALMALILPVPVDSPAKSALQRLRSWLFHGVAIFAGLFPSLFLWRLINRKHFGQSEFFSYFFQADSRTLTMAHWLQSRWDSLANTVIPLNVLLFHSGHPEMNSIFGPSPAIVRFFLQYWLALPFGVGIAFFFCLVRMLGGFSKKGWAWLAVIVFLPLASFTVYWGAASTGMLREGLHPWFLGVVILGVFAWRAFAATSQRFWILCNYALLFRGAEVLLLLLLPSIWSAHRLVQPEFSFSDAAMLVIVFTSTAWLYISMFRLSEELRKQAAVSNLMISRVHENGQHTSSERS